MEIGKTWLLSNYLEIIISGKNLGHEVSSGSYGYTINPYFLVHLVSLVLLSSIIKFDILDILDIILKFNLVRFKYWLPIFKASILL